MAYEFVTRLIVMRHVDGQWRQFPTSILRNPLAESEWVRLFPLQLHVLSFTRGKIGVATNLAEFRTILASMAESEAKVPYKVGKRQDAEFRATARPRTGGDRSPARIYGPTSR